MQFKLINVGFGNTAPTRRIVAIVGNGSLPVKRSNRFISSTDEPISNKVE